MVQYGAVGQLDVTFVPLEDIKIYKKRSAMKQRIRKMCKRVIRVRTRTRTMCIE